MAPPKQGSTHQMSAYFIDPERLSWPSWSTYSGRFIHINGHASAAGQAPDRKVRRGITDVLQLCYATNPFVVCGFARLLICDISTSNEQRENRNKTQRFNDTQQCHCH